LHKPTPLIKAPNLVLVGSSGRDAGKTTAALALIDALNRLAPDRVVALKVTTAGEPGAGCHRGGEGCGACFFERPFELDEETDPSTGKDTSRLLAAGAARSFWLRARPDSIADGFLAFQAQLPPLALVVAESNSLRRAVEPGLFIMLADIGGSSRPSAELVAPMADLLVETMGPVTPAAARVLAGRLALEMDTAGRPALLLGAPVHERPEDPRAGGRLA
jgi:hypothetical protein